MARSLLRHLSGQPMGFVIGLVMALLISLASPLGLGIAPALAFEGVD